LTWTAWSGGIEAGIFLSDQELAQSGLSEKLGEFFYQVDDLSYSVTDEFLEHVRASSGPLYAEEKDAKNRVAEARKKLGIAELSSLFDITKKPARDRRRNEFLKEWNATLQFLRDIAKQVVRYRPEWVPEASPAGAQTDAFLHAFYYTKVLVGNRSQYDVMFEENRTRTEAVLREYLKWWQELGTAPWGENEMLQVRLPKLQKLLSKDRVLT